MIELAEDDVVLVATHSVDHCQFIPDNRRDIQMLDVELQTGDAMVASGVQLFGGPRAAFWTARNRRSRTCHREAVRC